MSEFNTGKPPAGEAGMCVCAVVGLTGEFWKRWDGARWYDGQSISTLGRVRTAQSTKWTSPAPKAWRWAALAEITAAGIPESEARGMVHKSMLANAPWYPPQQDGFGPWIETDRSGTPPVQSGVVCDVLAHCEREKRTWAPASPRAVMDHWGWEWDEGDRYRLVAYCVKLATTEQAEPTTAEVEATQKPQSPEDFMRDMKADELAMNAGMLERDEERMWSKPKRVTLSTSTEPTPWHLRCAPWTNRFGGWGA